jgi:hypothetical protein
VGGQRIALPAAAVQRHHEQPGQRLAVRVLEVLGLQVGQQLPVVAASEPLGEQLLAQGRAELVEDVPVPAEVRRVRDVPQRPPPPEPPRPGQQGDPLRHVGGGASSLGERLGLGRVGARRLEREDVARRPVAQ